MLVLTNTFLSLQAVQHNPLLLVVPVHCPDCRRAEVLRVWRPQWDPLQGGSGLGQWGHAQSRGGRHGRPGPGPGVHGPHQQQGLRQTVRKRR